MQIIDIGDKFMYQGMPLEVVSRSSGAYGGLVWVAWPCSVNTLNRRVEAYLYDEFAHLIDDTTLKRIDDAKV